MPISVIFAGPDDSETCVGAGSCDEAVNNSPFDPDEDEVPVPGTLLCRGNCRHFLQIDGDSDESEDDDSDTDSPDIAYSVSTGFTDSTAPDDDGYDEARDQKIDAAENAINQQTQQQDDDDTDDDAANTGAFLGIGDYGKDIVDYLDDEVDQSSKSDLVDALTDSGLTIGPETDDLDNVDVSELSSAQLIDPFLAANEVDGLADVLSDGTNSDALEAAIALGEDGFDDADSNKAFTLADVLTQATGETYTAQLADDHNRWYVRKSS